MKKRNTYKPYLIIVFFGILFHSNNAYSIVEKIEYRGWENCYRLSNSKISVIINAAAGGRIMAYERDGINIIYENPDQDGKLLADYLKNKFDPDGGRFDYGQELTTRDKHAITFMGEWHGEIMNDHCLKIISQPDRNLGILSVRMFELDPITSQLSVTQIMKNISSEPTSYFFWGRTLVKVGGKLLTPLNPKSAMPGNWGRYIWGDPVEFKVDTSDPGVQIKNNMFSLVPTIAGNEKYGTDSREGWMAYGYKGLLFIKKYHFYENMSYTEHFNQTNIFYTNKKLFAEMEPISPTALLQPGEEYSYSENWYLIEYPPASDINFDIVKAAQFVKQYEYPSQ